MPNATFQHKGYTARPTLDIEAGTITGTVLGLRDVIHFEGKTIRQAEKAFRDSVNDYLAFCAENDREPEKPKSGKLQLRLDPRVHWQIATEAEAAGVSLNDWIVQRLSQTYLV